MWENHKDRTRLSRDSNLGGRRSTTVPISYLVTRLIESSSGEDNISQCLSWTVSQIIVLTQSTRCCDQLYPTRFSYEDSIKPQISERDLSVRTTTITVPKHVNPFQKTDLFWRTWIILLFGIIITLWINYFSSGYKSFCFPFFPFDRHTFHKLAKTCDQENRNIQGNKLWSAFLFGHCLN